MTQKLLRFTASWCKPCQSLAKALEQAELSIPIEVIDIDVHPELLDEYGIRGVPTMVLLPQRATLVGAKTSKEISDWVKQVS